MSKRLFRLLLALTVVSFFGQLVLNPAPLGGWAGMWAAGGNAQFRFQWQPVLLAALPLAGLLLMYLMPKLDPKRENYQKHRRAYNAFTVTITAVALAGSWASTLASLGVRLPMNTVTMVLAALSFAVVGNFMPQLRPNYFMGFKTPWTLDSETVWRRTHRFAGAAFVVGGCVFFLFAFTGRPLPVWATVALILLMLVAPTVYSYVIHRKLKHTEEEDHAEH